MVREIKYWYKNDNMELAQRALEMLELARGGYDELTTGSTVRIATLTKWARGRMLCDPD